MLFAAQFMLSLRAGRALPPPLAEKFRLWGNSLSVRTRRSRHILDARSSLTCGWGARSLQSLTKCPPSRQRHRSGVGLASGMLQNRLWGSIYNKTPGPNRLRKNPSPPSF